MPRACAYCGSGGPLTREHLFPEFIMRLHPTYRTYLSASLPGLVTTKSPVVRDVCRLCNNGRLSVLDNYGRSLCSSYLRRFVKPGELGMLSYDFHMLARWLWKVHYNTARSGDAGPGTYKALVPYILGDATAPPTPQTLLVGVLKADTATDVERAALHSRFFYPRAVRYADATLGRFHMLARLRRSLSINSYIFWSILWTEGPSRVERKEAAK